MRNIYEEAAPNFCDSHMNIYKNILAVPFYKTTWLTVNPDKNFNQMIDPYKSLKTVHTLPTTFCDTKVHCSNYQSNKNYFQKKQHYYVSFYFHKERYARMSHFEHKSFIGSKKTWLQASELCRSAGGTLPILRSKEELDELITLLQVGKGLSAIEFIFIGLAFNILVSVL